MNGCANGSRYRLSVINASSDRLELQTSRYNIFGRSSRDGDSSQSIHSRKGLAAKTKSLPDSRPKLFERSQLAGMSMSAESIKIFNIDSMAIVTHSYCIEIIGRNYNLNKASSGIDGIVKELLGHVARLSDDDRGAKMTDGGLR
jgi:hypothetical protein